MYSEQVADAHGRPVCRECLGQTLRDDESGEDVCMSCGTVVTSRESLLQVPASRAAIERELSRSTMTPILRNDLEIPTVLGSRDVDAKGRHLGRNSDFRQLRRLNTIVSWDPKRKKQARVAGEIRRVTDALGLGSAVFLRALEAYRSFDSVSRVSSVSAAAAASVCAACFELEIPRPPDDVVALRANVSEKKLRYHYKILVKATNPTGAPDPSIYVSSIAARASLSGLTERKALEILAKTKGSEELVGKRPVSIAAAALYIAALETHTEATQMQLAFAARVSPITVRKRSAELSKILQKAIPAQA